MMTQMISTPIWLTPVKQSRFYKKMNICTFEMFETTSLISPWKNILGLSSVQILGLANELFYAKEIYYKNTAISKEPNWNF